VAIKGFYDYIVVLVVKRMLGKSGAVNFFSLEHGGGLSDAELADMAAETYIISTIRMDFKHRRARYSKAL
jgi:hypothetical protein